MNVDRDSQLTGTVIGAAITVHRALGPGVDEPAYEEALSAELTDLERSNAKPRNVQTHISQQLGFVNR